VLAKIYLNCKRLINSLIHILPLNVSGNMFNKFEFLQFTIFSIVRNAKRILLLEIPTKIKYKIILF